MEKLSEQQKTEIIEELKKSGLPRKTQDFLIDLINEVNKEN